MATRLRDRLIDGAIVALTALAIIGGLFEAIQAEQGEDDPHLLRPGTAAPPLTAVAHSDPGIRLGDSDLRGKVVVLDFWATWCEPCREEAPRIRDLAQQYQSSDRVAILALDEEGADSPSEARERVNRFIQEERLQGYPVYYPSAEVPAAYRVESLPTLYVIDPHWTVRFSRRGTVAQSRLRDEIEAMLKE